MKFYQHIFYIPRYTVMLLIKIYQKTFSPDHGPLKKMYPNGYCRFYPTCSEYGYKCFKKYGVVKGSIKTVWRIMRCNPWNKGGVDLP